MEKLKGKNLEWVTMIIGVLMVVGGGFMPIGKFEGLGVSLETNLVSIVGGVLACWNIVLTVYSKVVNRDLPK